MAGRGSNAMRPGSTAAPSSGTGRGGCRFRQARRRPRAGGVDHALDESTMPDALEQRSRATLHVAVFGTLCGLLEITLGTTLKGLRIPFTGLIMTALVTILCLAGRRFAPRRGSILMMGGVAALLKIFSIGGFILGPFWAILIEAALAEAVISALGLNRLSCMLSGTLLLAYTTVHPFITQRILYGADIFRIYLKMLRAGGRLLGVEDAPLLLILGAWGALMALLGSAAGLTGHRLGHEVEARIRRIRGEERAA